MGIYAKNVETLLKDVEHIQSNILHEYDNWTYHIQMFMIPQDSYLKYSKLNSNAKDVDSFLELEKILKERKVIIAESGITSGISIESLKMITLPPTNEECYGVTTTSLELNLKEIGSCSLMNKIALASYACAYNSYVNQPFFISIWFEGYDNVGNNNKGGISKKIPLYVDDNGIIIDTLTYCVIMNVQNSIMEGNTTSYKISLLPFYYGSYSKEISHINDLGEMEIRQWDSLGKMFRGVEDKINEKLFVQYGANVIKNVYKNKRPFKIDVDDNIKGLESTYKKINKLTRENLYKWKYEIADRMEEKTGSSVLGFVAFSSAALYAPLVRYKLWRERHNSEMTISPDDYDSIQSFIRKIFNGYLNGGTKGYIPVIEYNSQFLGEYYEKAYYAHNITIKLQESPGLFKLTQAVGENQSIAYKEHPEKNQEEYLTTLYDNNLLRKRYEWILNGRNIDVLNLKKSENNLWYLNIGLTNVYKVDKNYQQEIKNIKNTILLNGQVEYASDIIPKSKKSDYVNKVMYVDDLYDMMTNDDRKKGINKFFGIALANEPIASLEPNTKKSEEKEKNVDDEKMLEYQRGSIATQVGMQNVFQWGGQRMKIDMDIFGDPYWLFYSSDGTKFTNNIVSLPHIIVCTKSFFSNDAMDNYKADDLMELNTVYMITKIISSLDNGKFTQKLEGFVATPFIQESYSSDESNANENNKKTNNKTSSMIVNDSGKITKLQ